MTYLFIAYNMHHYTVLEVPYMHQHTFFIKLPCGLNCAVYALLSERDGNVHVYYTSSYGFRSIAYVELYVFQLKVQFLNAMKVYIIKLHLWCLIYHFTVFL